MLTRHQVLRSPCPTCLAGQGERCRRSTDDPEAEGTRVGFHQDRRTYARLRHREAALKRELQEIRDQLRPMQDAFLVEGPAGEQTPSPASQPHFTDRGLK
jgi:hypothetical protein